MPFLKIKLRVLLPHKMKYLKIFLLLVFFSLISFFTPSAFAQEKKDIVLVNPIRGSDFWTHNFSILDTPSKQYEIIKKDNLPATWLVRYDALIDPNVQNFLKGLDPSQDIGIFFEITPALTRDAGVSYNQGATWHVAKSVLLTGYSPGDRNKLIDTAMKKYKEVFNKNPKSVGAWWIDANSLNYMKDKYQIEANLDVSDQYMTDGYQVWGQYWSTPFYPSKSNALVPAQSSDQKIGVVTMQWAPRDPFNGYGNGVFESTYSVQANDYILHNLGIDYFEKLLKIYPETTIGLENDFNFSEFGPEYQRQLELIVKEKALGNINVLSMAGFAQKYMRAYPNISPNVIIQADDPLGSGGKVVWINTPKYRVGWFYNQEGSSIRDLRKFNDRSEEGCLKVACDELKLALDSRTAIDDGNYMSSWVLDEGQISDVKVTPSGYGAEITYKNQAGTERKIKFLENDVEFDGKIDTLDGAILRVLTSNQNATPQDDSPFDSKLEPSAVQNIFINAFKFLGLLILFFILPGFALTRNKLLAIPVGISVFTLFAWIFGFLKIDFLIWILPIISAVIILRRGRPTVSLPNFSKNNLVLGSLILIGSFSWMITQFKNGLLFNYGLGFWGPNGHDAIWHLSLISELQKNVPPNNPIYAGVSLSNYHYFFDLLVAKSANIFGIDPVELLFRLFPILISVLAGILIFKVTQKIFNSFWAAFFATFFLYFGGSFGWILTYLKDGGFGGETMFWAQQSISTLLNPPFAISVVLFLAGLWIFYELLQKQNDRWSSLIALILLWGTLIEFKAYAGILVLGAYGLFSLQRILFKRDFSVLIGFIPTLILSLVVFLPNNSGSESLIEYQPFWLVESMINAADRLGWQRLTLAIESGIWWKLLYGYSLGILIFLVGNFGTRIISIAAIKQIFKNSFLVYFILLSVLLPLIFVQKGTAWNIVQFLYYGMLVLNIFAGIGLYNLAKRMPKFLGIIFVIIIMLLTVPTTLGTFQHYLPERAPAKISQQELEALTFLKSQPHGNVLVFPFDEKLRSKFNTPIPLELYTSTAYVSAFSGKPVFLEDTVNLEILGIDYKGRLNTVRDFMRNRAQSKEILNKNNISYVYLPKLFNFQVDENSMGIKQIFENNEVKIYQTQ